MRNAKCAMRNTSRTYDMEHIIDTTQSGSAILAYGKAPKKGVYFKWILIGLIALAAFCSMGLWILLCNVTVRIPSDRLILAALKPAAVAGRMPSELVQDLPAPWRAAMRTDSRLPVFFGASLDERGAPHAFALVLRQHAVAASGGLAVKSKGMMTLLTDGTINENIESVRFSELLRLWRRIGQHDAAWMIESRELARLLIGLDGTGSTTFANAGTGGAVFGTWDGLRGMIELPPTGVESVAASAPITVTLGPDRSDAQPVINALSSQGIDVRFLDAPPSVIFVSPEDRNVRLGWSSPVSEHDRLLVRGALGLSTLKEYALPDQTVAKEYAPGDRTFSSLSGTLFSSNGEEDMPTSDPPLADPCPGSLRLLLKGIPLRNLLAQWSFPESWIHFISSVQVRETDMTIICIND
jgi:hypothetical protein